MDLELILIVFCHLLYRHTVEAFFSCVRVGHVGLDHKKTRDSVFMKALSYISLALYQMRVNTQFMQSRVL